MKNIKNFIFGIAMMMAIVLVTQSVQTVYAEEKPQLNATKGIVYKYGMDSINVLNVPGGVEKISWQSDNTKVLKVKSYSKIGRECYLTPIAEGSANVICNIKVNTGKEYTLNCKIYVKNEIPFNKVYVGGKNIYKKNTNTASVNTTASKIKTSVRVKGGWNLESATYEAYKNEKAVSSSGNIPKNNIVPVGKYKTEVTYVVRNEATEGSFTYKAVIYKASKKDAQPKLAAKSGTIFVNSKENMLKVNNLKATDKVTWKSSKKSIARISAISKDKTTATIKPVRKGKATITCTVVRGKKTYNLAYKLTVQSAVRPFDSIEVDGSNIINKTKSNYYAMNVRDYSMRVQSEEKSGWRIISETYVEYTTPSKHGIENKITGHGDVPVGSYKTTCYITVKKNTTGAKYTFTLDMFNKNYQK